MSSESSYDFRQIRYQGAYVSTYTPQKLSDYLK